ncbi:hypothetical protein [Flavobacterium sp.]|uniref:hypothetical protein n=1 Tax=Flavobacterium sp. TaxID=239 RepID=UPI00260CC557|nr:hypothetical protein [Flavobacterium sp.]
MAIAFEDLTQVQGATAIQKIETQVNAAVLFNFRVALPERATLPPARIRLLLFSEVKSKSPYNTLILRCFLAMFVGSLVWHLVNPVRLGGL